MVNSEAIKRRLKELNLTQGDLGRHLGIEQSTANQKINNVRPFTLDEAEQTANFLQISDSEFSVFFFARELHSATA